MAELLKIPNPILRNVSVDVLPNEDLTQLYADMRRIMAENRGIGLAAIQIGVPKRVISIKETFMLNPRFRPSKLAKVILVPEACLSVPDTLVVCQRYDSVEVDFFTPRWQSITRVLAGEDAIIAQHECDHLSGILISDRKKG